MTKPGPGIVTINLNACLRSTPQLKGEQNLPIAELGM